MNSHDAFITNSQNEIPFIDISETQCWMVYIMPFNSGERTNYQLVDSFQRRCIEERVFGMGWDLPCFEYGTPISEENACIYADKYKERWGGQVSDDALKGYLQIKKNDYVIMRLKNSHYYVGRVSSDSAFYMYKENDPLYGNLSWGCTVEQWIEYPTDDSVPSEIVGRFSQRLHSTIQRFAKYRQRLLVIAMYENVFAEDQRHFIVPKLKIDASNFTESLNYRELEDLVALYISEHHKQDGYVLIPSSCKVSQPDYEFRFVSGHRKPITCQVKNKEIIEIDHYTGEKAYERVYIFSGLWSNEEVENKRRMYGDYSHIYIIKPSELFETLSNNLVFYNNFYDYCAKRTEPTELPLDKYRIVKKPKRIDECSISKNYACFVQNDGLFYSAEFGALILSWHILGKHDEEVNCAQRIIMDINAKG